METENQSKSGAGEEGTDELLDTYKKDTPGQQKDPLGRPLTFKEFIDKMLNKG